VERFSTKIIFALFVIILVIPVVLPYLHSGYFPTHDGEWAVVRMGDMFRQIKDMQFPPRYSGALNFGYGYPLFNFTYPFPYYLGIVLYLPLHNFVLSVKTIFVASVFLSSILMYLASSYLWKSRVAGLISSIIYIYLPYRVVDLYVRGSIGESLAFALFPLILYLCFRLFDSPFGRLTVVSLSLSLAILVMTHNIMAILFLPVLIGFMTVRIVSEKKWDVLQSFSLCLLLGAGLSSFFWFPALYEKGNILLSKIPIADRNLYFVKPLQLIIPSWGYAPPTEKGGFSYQLGIPQIIVMLSVLGVLVQSYFKTRLNITPAKYYALILLIIYFICLAMMFSFTSLIWHLPLLKEINYPWTLLSQLGLISALLSGFLAIQHKIIQYLVFTLCVLAVVMVFPSAHPEKFVDRGDQFYLTNEATTTSSSELMPLWVKDMPSEHYNDKVEVIMGNASITNLQTKSNRLSFNYKAEGPVAFRINTIYYPGWRAYLNNDEVKIKYNNPKGVIEFEGNQYRDSVLLSFQETFPRMIVDMVSIASFIILAFILLRPILLFKS
jgi:uncharacterized membrane protein